MDFLLLATRRQNRGRKLLSGSFEYNAGRLREGLETLELRMPAGDGNYLCEVLIS